MALHVPRHVTTPILCSAPSSVLKVFITSWVLEVELCVMICCDVSPNTTGCFCPSGLVELGDHCVPQEFCPNGESPNLTPKVVQM